MASFRHHGSTICAKSFFRTWLVKSLRPHSELFFDVHLMVSNPFDMLLPFIDAGADGISFHIEATESRFTFHLKF